MSETLLASNATRWQLQQFQAKFIAGRISGACNLLTPYHGLHELSVDGSSIAGVQLLGLNLPEVSSQTAGAALECYTRCGDLVGIYGPTDSHPFRSQTYWRLTSHRTDDERFPAVAAIELTAAKQTELLDSRPDLSVESYLPFMTAWRLIDVNKSQFETINVGSQPTFSRPGDLACFLFRLPGEQLSYVEMVYPLDFETSRFACEPHGGQNWVSTRHDLFVHRLEKGVILRARVLGLLLARDNDMPAAAAHYAAFAASAPPLTT